MNNNNLFNRKDLKSFRSSLRKSSTSAESTLWDMLKSRKLDGRKFRRQYSIGSFIADFCCPSEKLIIELDGDLHGEYHKIQKDENRDKYLLRLGFTVLRFENRFVFQEPEYIKSEIRKVLNRNNESTPNKNQPPRPDTDVSGHPSFKRGNFFRIPSTNYSLSLTAMPWGKVRMGMQIIIQEHAYNENPP